MSSFGSTWATASADGSTSDGNKQPPAEGNFDVALTDAGAFTSKKGEDWVKLEWRVLGGPHTGYEWTQMSGFKSQGAATATKTTCAKIGVPVDQVQSLEALDNELKALAGTYWAITVERNGDWLNAFVDGRATGAVSDIPSDVPATTVDSDPDLDDRSIPFKWEPTTYGARFSRVHGTWSDVA